MTEELYLQTFFIIQTLNSDTGRLGRVQIEENSGEKKRGARKKVNHFCY